MKEVSITFDVLGVLITILVLHNCISERVKNDQTNLFLGLTILNIMVLLADMFTWILEERPEFTLLLYILNTLVYGGGYLMVSLYSYYLLYCIREVKKISMLSGHVIGITSVLACIFLVIAVCNRLAFSFDNGVYIRGPLFWMNLAYPIVIVAIDMGIIIKNHKVLEQQRMFALMSYSFFPLMALFFQFTCPDVTVIYIATTFAILLIYMRVYIDQRRELKGKEFELAQMKISIMLSQIQPHFLYNALNSIQMLCIKNPERAKQALGEFSKFLRGNMDSLSSQTPIPFSRELEHVENYLNLEKIRFGEKLHVEYEIEEDDFFIPALTLQTIVENAVKHGIGNKEEGGTITISTKLDGDRVLVVIQDNGVGFAAKNIDELPVKEDGNTHIGISNVRNRMIEMMGGSLELFSENGVGTTVTIVVPKLH